MSDRQLDSSSKSLMCPSADAEMSGSVIFGIVVGTPEEPHLVHLDRVKPIPPELLTLDTPSNPPKFFGLPPPVSKLIAAILMVRNVVSPPELSLVYLL
jgi:hypothetical protein